MQDLGAKGFGKSFFVYKYKNFDLSLARYENKISKGHRGFKTFICDNEKEASFRRDFTINSMMMNIFDDRFLDFYGGLEDLNSGILRHIDDDKFKEDSLRVFRAVHFVSRFDFKVHQKSLELMRAMDISDLSLDRINIELYKFFSAKNLLLGFLLLQDLNLEEKVFHFSSKDHKDEFFFKNLLESTRAFILDSGLFLYLYLNLFKIDKKDFFSKTKMKKEFLKKSLQSFIKDGLSYEELCFIALKMPLKEWLGLWDKKRIFMAKKLSLYEEKFKVYINTNELIKDGFKDKDLALKIRALQRVAIKNKCTKL